MQVSFACIHGDAQCMKPKRDLDGVLDGRDRAVALEKVDAILLQRVHALLLQRVKRKRKLQPL